MPSAKFCPKCGKDTEEFHGGMCADCFGVKIGLPKDFPKKAVVNECKLCGRFFYKKEGLHSRESGLGAFLSDVLGRDGVRNATYRLQGKMIFLTLDMESDGVEKVFQANVPLVEKMITCESCSLMKARYYNVTLQIRAPQKTCDIVLADVERIVKKRSDEDRLAFVAEVQRKKEGIDILIGSKSAAEKVVKYLKSKYKVTTNVSHSLYGPVEGKNKYRDTILVRVGD